MAELFGSIALDFNILTLKMKGQENIMKDANRHKIKMKRRRNIENGKEKY